MSEATAAAIVARQPWEMLVPLVRGMGADPDLVLARLRQYAIDLVAWNGTVSNLMSSNDVARIVERHLVESIEPAPMLLEFGCHSYVDFGSGAGFPAIPLALAGVGERWVLVESRRPKTLFLRKTLKHIRINNVEVVHDRLENLESVGFDGLTARATERIGPTLRVALRHIRAGGMAFLWKGSGWRSEMDTDRSWEEGWTFEKVSELRGRPSVIAVFKRKEVD